MQVNTMFEGGCDNYGCCRRQDKTLGMTRSMMMLTPESWRFGERRWCRPGVSGFSGGSDSSFDRHGRVIGFFEKEADASSDIGGNTGTAGSDRAAGSESRVRRPGGCGRLQVRTLGIS
jgi:hypothetical protein